MQSSFYSGKCKGGPLDGQMMAHDKRTKKFFSPMVAGLSLNENAPIIPVTIGEYYWAAHNYWQWSATKEGKALKTLQDAQLRHLRPTGGF